MKKSLHFDISLFFRSVTNRGTGTYMFDCNLEREVAVDTYTLGQVPNPLLPAYNKS